MKSSIPLIATVLLFSAVFASANCGNCPGGKKAMETKTEETAHSGKDCAGCPMHANSPAKTGAEEKTHGCPHGDSEVLTWW